ncbi:MAG: head-tail connector protein [Bacillota bacterium]
MVELRAVKEYLRVDGDEEDNFITSLIITAQGLVEGVVRAKFEDFEEEPEVMNQAVMFAVATMFENRQGGKDGLNMAEMLDIIRRMTFAVRCEAW